LKKAKGLNLKRWCDAVSVKAAGYDMTTALVVTNAAEYRHIEAIEFGEVSVGGPLLKVSN